MSEINSSIGIYAWIMAILGYLSGNNVPVIYKIHAHTYSDQCIDYAVILGNKVPFVGHNGCPGQYNEFYHPGRSRGHQKIRTGLWGLTCG